jgi:hypothetical protein
MKAAITLVFAQLGLVALAIAAGTAQADPYRYHHDYYKLVTANGAGAQSKTGFRVPVRINPNLTWLHRGLTPPRIGAAGAQSQTGVRVNPTLTWLHRDLTPPQISAAGAQSQTGASHGFPWSSVGLGLGVAVVAGLLLLAVLKLTRRGHTTAV